jgi:hypothetical protein
MPNKQINLGISGDTLRKYVGSRKRIKFIIGPLGSGKTVTSVQHLLELVSQQKPDANGKRRSRTIAIRNTYPDLETTTIPDFREVFTDELGKFKHSNPPRFDMDQKLPDGTRIVAEFIFLALDQPEDVRKLRGTQCTFGWLNETKEIPKEALDMLDSRIGRYPSRMDLGSYYHGIIGDTNAPDEDHWLAEYYENPPQNWEILMQPGGVMWINNQWVLNPTAENINNLPEGYYHNLIQGKRKDWIQVNVANQFGLVKDGKPVHPDFSREVHVAQMPLEVAPGVPVYVGIDFGRTPAATFGQHVNGQWRILGELVTEDMSAIKFGRVLKPYLNKHFENNKMEIWADPAGEAQAQTRDETPFDMLAVNGIEAYPCWTNDPSLRINSLDMLLTTMSDGQPNIIIDPSCRVLIRALNGGYRFKRMRVSGEEPVYKDKPDKNKWSHVAEALQYMLLGGGESDVVVPEMDNQQYAIENEEDFAGWHAAFTGL